MGVRKLNHAVLFVSDLARSVAFYETVLGFERLPDEFPGGVFLRCADSANDHDLGLFQAGSSAQQPAGVVGLYHLAWEVATLAELADTRDRLDHAGALVGGADHVATKALYARDPDGIEFEVCWQVPDDLVEDAFDSDPQATAPLDLDAESTRYGATTLGGPRTDREVWSRVASRIGRGY